MTAVDATRAHKPSSPPSSRARTGAPPAPPAVHIAEDAFVSETTLDDWVRSGAAVRAGALLSTSDGRSFLLRDAVRVIGRRNGDTDPYGLTGRVEAIRDFIRRGASISADALRLGPAIYDIEYGLTTALAGAVAAPAAPAPRVM
jgi:hypothetical protein